MHHASSREYLTYAHKEYITANLSSSLIASHTEQPSGEFESTKPDALHGNLGAFQLIMMGVGATIGTGIFVLTSEAAQKAGPAMLFSFLLAAAVCGVAALCYAELAVMIPRAGSEMGPNLIDKGESWHDQWMRRSASTPAESVLCVRVSSISPDAISSPPAKKSDLAKLVSLEDREGLMDDEPLSSMLLT